MNFGATRSFIYEERRDTRGDPMADATIKRVEDMEAFYGGMVRRARASLGVTSWGMQIFDLPPGFDEYPNHHHGNGQVDPGQEEVYIPLAGSATLVLNGDRQSLEPGVWARVGVTQLRRLLPGPEGFRFLAIGGTPGRAFTPPAWTELGAAPPGMPE
jgi:hypothetical protein